MIKIAIVEDDKNDSQTLQNYIKRFEQEYNVMFQISIFSDGLDIVSDYSGDFDIILLDIQMKHLDGMKTAQSIRRFDEDVIFIFITSTVEFAIQGYLVDALGYLLKPVPYLPFSQLIQKAIKRIEHKQKKSYLTIEVDSNFFKLSLEQIYYMESQRHSIHIHSERGEFTTAGPLKKMEETLHHKGFSKCHNAYLVNLHHVTRISSNHVLLSNQLELPLSRTKKKTFMNDLTDYLGGTY